MTLIVQLSDLHLLSGSKEQPAILEALPRALRREQERRGKAVQLLAVTGDVFDSAGLGAGRAAEAYVRLDRAVSSALGRRVFTVIVPGNHDRRMHGMLGPHRTSLFERLGAQLGSAAWVHGNQGHFLAGVVPRELHDVRAWIMAYDSTYLPLGLVSAGGALRQEDLLHAAARIAGQQPEWPLIFLLHHHLVPTPLTDVGPVETEQLPRVIHWTVSKLLPRLVSNADREELTMTALGSGTALSILHTLGRPVLVLHGHKHYATARHLGATRSGQGDVLIVSGGSAGTAQSWFPTTAREAARLWPSFNMIELNDDGVSADVVSFGYRGDALGETRVVPLLRAKRDGPHWQPQLISQSPVQVSERKLGLNALQCTLLPSRTPQRWDVEYQRRYDGLPGEAPASFEDTIDALEDSDMFVVSAPGGAGERYDSPPCQLRIKRGETLNYRIEGALCRHVAEAHRLFGRRWAPYSWLGIMNRYAAGQVRLEVNTRHDARLNEAFASETDLGSGETRPLRVQVQDKYRVVVTYSDCPARTLVRLHWPMDA